MAINTAATRNILSIPNDPYQPLRKKVQKGFEDLSAEPLYDAAQPLGRAYRSGLEQQTAQGAMGLSFNADAIKQQQLAEIDRQAEESRQRLGRVYALDPSGLRGGSGQRQFEQLESGVIGTKAQTSLDILNRANEQARANVGVQQGLLAQTGNEDRAGRAQQLAGLQAGQGFLGQEEQMSLAQQQEGLQEREQAQASEVRASGLTGQYQGQQTQQAQQQQWAQGFSGRQQTEAEATGGAQRTQMGAQTVLAQRGQTEAESMGSAQRQQMAAVTALQQQAQALDTKIREAELSGNLNGMRTLQAQRDALETEIQRAGVGLQAGQLTGVYQGQQTLASRTQGLEQQRLNLDTEIQRAQLSGNLNGVRTLQAQREALDAEIQRAQIALQSGQLTGTYNNAATLQSLNDAMARAIQKGDATGTFTDPVTGKSLTTIQAEIQRGQLVEQTAARKDQTGLAAGSLTGVYGGGEITSADLGVDVRGAVAANGSLAPGGFEKFMAVGDALDKRGLFDGKSQQEMEQMVWEVLNGGSIMTPGTQTLAAQAQTFTQGVEQARLMGTFDDQPTLEAKMQDLAKAIQEAGVTGTYGGGELRAQDLGVDVTGALAANGSLAPGGTSKFMAVADALGKRGLFEGKLPADQEQMVWEILSGGSIMAPGTQTLQKTLQDAQLEFERARLSGTLKDAPTLQKLLQDGQLALQAGELTGTYQNSSTLAAGRQAADITAQQAATSLSRTQLAQQQGQFLTEQTGQVGGGTLSAAMLGVDAAGIFRPDGTTDVQRYMEAGQQVAAALQSSGLTNVTNQMVDDLLRGKQIQAQGGTTLAARQQALLREQQTNQQKLAEAELSGNLNDKQTLQARQVEIDRQIREMEQNISGMRAQTELEATRAGLYGTYQDQQTVASKEQSQASAVRQQLANLESTRTTLQAEIQQATLTGDLNGKATLEAQLQTLNGEIQRGQLSLAQEQEQARQQEARAGLTGALPVTAQDLGLNLDDYRDPWGRVSTAGVNALNQQFMARFGRIPTQSELGPLLAGQGVNMDVSTLGARQAGVAEAAQQATETAQTRQLDLADRQELSRQREAEAAATGEWQTTLSPIQIGLDPSQYRNPDGTADFGRFATYLDAHPEIADNFREIMGRDMTNEEQSALFRGQDVMGTYRPTMEQQKLNLESAIARAEQSGTYQDPTTGHDLDTLEAQLQDFNIERAQTQDAFDSRMALAQQTGYVTLGSGGTLSAQDLGVDTQYVAQLSNEDALASTEAQRLQSAYQAMTNGQSLNNQQLVSLLRNGTTDVDQEIQVETLAARAQREQSALGWSELSGQIGTAKTEAAREFDRSLAERKDLTEAQVAQINAGIRQADTQLDQNLIQFASEKQIAWAELLGEGYSNGSVTAATLGVTVSKPLREMSTAEVTELQGTLQAAFTAMTGRNPTATELRQLADRGTVAVANSPTLAAKSLATQVSTQALERQADLHKFSTQYSLDERKFTEMQEEADRQFGQTATQISQQYNLDQDKFLMAKMELDASLTGRVGISGSMSAADLGLALPSTPVQYLSAEEHARLDKSIRTSFTALQGRAPTTAEVGSIMGGGSVQVQALSTLEGRQWAANQADIAQRYGFDQQQFTEASDQFDRQFNMNERNSWMQLNGFANIDPATGELNYTGTGNTWTTDYRKYTDAKAAFNESETKRDMLWQKAIFNSMKEADQDVNALVARGLFPNDWTRQSTTDLRNYYSSRVGVVLTDAQISDLRNNRTIKLNVPGISEGDIAALSDMINGFNMSVAQANQGSGWMQLAGSAIGAAGMIAAAAI